MADKWIQLQSENGEDNLFPTSKYDLLWTNSAPGTSFIAQTVELDLSGYTKILLVSKVSAYVSSYFNYEFIVDGIQNQVIIFDADAMGGIQARKITVTSTGVTFSAAVYGNNQQTQTLNSLNVPYKIYGIK